MAGGAVDHQPRRLPLRGGGEDGTGVLRRQDQGRDPEGRTPGGGVQGDGLAGRAVGDEDEAGGAGGPDLVGQGAELGLADAGPAPGGQLGDDQGADRRDDRAP